MEAYYEKMLALAETIAVNAHKSQLDKGGHPLSIIPVLYLHTVLLLNPGL